MKKIFTKFILFYIKFFASIQLKKIKPIIIGVGGASGKSSTSSLIYEILSTKYRVKEGKGKNSETGIPLNILDIKVDNYSSKFWLTVLFKAPLSFLTNFKKYDIFVAELGIDSPLPPKNMSYLLSFIQPKIALLTNISIEHSFNFDSLVKSENEKERKKEILDLISKEESLLLKSVDESGRTFINLDNTLIKKNLPLKSKVITVSMKDKSADFYISKIINNENEFIINFIFLKENYTLKINTPLPDHYAYSFIFAIANAFYFEINIRDSIKILEEKFSLPPGRFTKFQGIKNTLVFDSSYNSSPEALAGSLDLIKEVAGKRRKVGILGDMRELGSISKIEHEQIAKKIIKDLDMAILIGENMRDFVVPILTEANFDFIFYDNFAALKKNLIDNIKNRDIILVKASQNSLFLERAVELLLENKKDIAMLARREKYWETLRRE